MLALYMRESIQPGMSKILKPDVQVLGVGRSVLVVILRYGIPQVDRGATIQFTAFILYYPLEEENHCILPCYAGLMYRRYLKEENKRS